MKARYVVLINIIWTMLWSTIVFLSNGEYPHDYNLWFLIIYGCVMLIPWIFMDQECIDFLNYDSAKANRKP